MLCFNVLYNYKPHQYYAYWGATVIFIIAAFRSGEVGNDLERYISMFMSEINRESAKADMEWGYNFLNEFLRFFSNDAQWFIFSTSLLILLPLFILIIKKSSNPVFSMMIFFIIINGFGFFLTAIRQALAVVICLWAFNFANNKKIALPILLIVIAAGIHASALFCIVFLLLAYKEFNQKIYLTLLFISVLIGFGFRINVFDVLPLLGALPIFSEHVEIYSGYSDYFTEASPNFNGLFLTIVPTSIFAYYAIKKNSISIYSRLLCVGTILTNIFASTPMIPRYFMYCTICQVVIIPAVYSTLTKCGKIVMCGTIILLMLYFLLFSLKINGIDNYNFYN